MNLKKFKKLSGDASFRQFYRTNNSILVYDVETDIWKTIKLPDGEYVTYSDNYLINVEDEQGLFAIITSWENITTSSILYFNLTYESFSKLP